MTPADPIKFDGYPITEIVRNPNSCRSIAFHYVESDALHAPCGEVISKDGFTIDMWKRPSGEVVVNSALEEEQLKPHLTY